MTTTQLQERAKLLYNSPYVSEELNKRNQEQWMKAVTDLGEKWLFAKRIQRKG